MTPNILFERNARMDFQDKVAVVTGGARGIGKAIADAFMARGAHVCTIDLLENDFFVGDLAGEHALEAFAAKVLARYGKIDYLINNAMLSKGGLNACSYEDFNYALRVGAAAPYYLAKLFSSSFHPGGAIVNISSTRFLMSQPNTESYTAAKGAITSLTHALAVTLSGRVRVNAVAPGWIDTANSELSSADRLQQPVGHVGTPEDIANAVLFLCGEKSAFITGQVLPVDGGMTKLMVYHGDEGWSLNPPSDR